MMVVSAIMAASEGVADSTIYPSPSSISYSVPLLLYISSKLTSGLHAPVG